MNKTYRLVWNELTNSWVAVAEIVKARGKRASRALLLAGMTAAALPATTFAQPSPAPTDLPTGGQVVAGQAGIAQSGATMNITQSTVRAAIDWQTFNVGSSATVNFIQPSSSAVTLNRVLSSNPSQIFGQINANGQVFLSNPGGVYFAPGASVNVGSLVATTHGITNDDFMAGNDRFSRNGATGSVVNEGTLTAELNGYIALLAPEVRNHGVVIAQMGTVALAAGEAYELQFAGSNTLAGIQVEPTTLAALVENGNAVQAPGGLVILSARAADRLQGSVVRNSGAIEAGGLVEKGGRILLEGDHITLANGSLLDAKGATGGGEVLVGGGWQGSGGMYQATTVTMAHGAIIDVSATQVGDGGTAVLWSDVTNADSVTTVKGTITARGGTEGGDGGRIETSGARLDIADSVRIGTQAPGGKTGEWLLDPVDITVASSGGNVTGSAIATALESTNVTLDTSGTGSCTGVTCSGLGGTNGDITIDDNINVTDGSADTTLTFKADRNIKLNASKSITRSGDHKLNTIFWADSDATNGGYIALFNGSAITTNGGHLWLGGGSGSATWNGLTVGNGYAVGTDGGSNGIFLQGTTISTGGGNIAMYGKSRAGQARGATTGDQLFDTDSNSNGIRFATTHAVNINSGAGTILLDGVSQGTSSGNWAFGIQFENLAHNVTSAATSGEAITLVGTGTTDTTTAGSSGIWFNRTDVLQATGGGNIVLTGTGGNSTNYKQDINFAAAGTISAGTGNLTVNANTLAFHADARLSGTDNLLIQPRTAGTTIGIAGGTGTLALTATNFSTNFVDGFSGITIGSANAGAITVGGTTTFRDSTTLLTNSTIALNGAVTANENLTLTANGAITQTAAVAVSGTTSITAGSGNNITLANADNNFTGAVSVVSGNNVSLRDTNAMALGASTVSGNLTLQTGGAITQNQAVSVTGSASITAGSGNNITLDNAGNNFTGAVSVVSGNNVSLRDTNAMALGASTVSGNLTLQTGGAITQSGALAVTGITGITAGSGNNITLGSANNFTGAVSIVSGNNVILGYDASGMVLGESTISGNLEVGTGFVGSLTQSGALSVSGTTQLTMPAAGSNVTLDNTSNHFTGVVTVPAVGGGPAVTNLTLVSSNAMSLGAVKASGTIDVATLTNNLTLTGTVETTNATADALKLNAGKSTAAGTATGGNIIVSGGSVSVGSGGRATLYTGSVSDSTGLTTLVGSGSDRFRYNSDEAASNFTTALTAGANAIYREQPTVTVTANNESKTYDGVAYSGGNGVGYGGFVNGDTSSGLGGTLAYGGTSQDATNVGSYAITPSGLTTGLGYALAFADGTLTINAAPTPPPPPVVSIAPLPVPETSPPPPALTVAPPAESGMTLAVPAATTATASGISVDLVQAPSVQQVGIISVSVPKEMATAGAGFSFPLPAQVMVDAPPDAQVQVTLLNGNPLPAWLRFIPETNSFSATAVPDGAFPIQLTVTVGGHSSTVVISERTE